MTVDPPDFLSHRAGDSVAVAVTDLSPGPATGSSLDGSEPVQVTVTGAIPLGHKVALTDIPSGQDVIEYGVRIGTAAADIASGDHVHVHNLRSARWQTSIA